MPRLLLCVTTLLTCFRHDVALTAKDAVIERRMPAGLFRDPSVLFPHPGGIFPDPEFAKRKLTDVINSAHSFAAGAASAAAGADPSGLFRDPEFAKRKLADAINTAHSIAAGAASAAAGADPSGLFRDPELAKRKITDAMNTAHSLAAGAASAAAGAARKASEVPRQALENFAINISLREWVHSHDYPVERFAAKTEDGLALVLFRLPRPGKQPVLLQHGVLDSAWAWVFNTEFKALAFALFDAGYDVWLGNNRGNSFSHHYADGTDGSGIQAYWNFTFDDMARYDVPALIHTVLNESGHQKLAYIGHSQGTMQFFIAASDPALKHKVADRVSVFLALSPVAWVGHMEVGIIRHLSRAGVERFVSPLFTAGGFMDGKSWRSFAKQLCLFSNAQVCKFGIETLCGRSYLDSHRQIQEFSSKYPGGTSYKNMLHFAQSVREGKFRRFDYGLEGNLREYGQKSPPEYDLSKFAVKTALFIAGSDKLSDREDVDILVSTIAPNNRTTFVKTYDEFSHMTWMLGKKEASFYIDDVIKVLADN